MKLAILNINLQNKNKNMKKLILMLCVGLLLTSAKSQTNCTTFANGDTYSVQTEIYVTKVNKDTVNKKHQVTVDFDYNITITGTNDSIYYHVVEFSWDKGFYYVSSPLPFKDSSGSATTTVVISQNKNRKIFDLSNAIITTTIKGRALNDTSFCAVILKHKSKQISNENSDFEDYWDYSIINNEVQIIGEIENFGVYNLDGKKITKLVSSGMYVISNKNQNKVIYFDK